MTVNSHYYYALMIAGLLISSPTVADEHTDGADMPPAAQAQSTASAMLESQLDVTMTIMPDEPALPGVVARVIALPARAEARAMSAGEAAAARAGQVVTGAEGQLTQTGEVGAETEFYGDSSVGLSVDALDLSLDAGSGISTELSGEAASLGGEITTDIGAEVSSDVSIEMRDLGAELGGGLSGGAEGSAGGAVGGLGGLPLN